MPKMKYFQIIADIADEIDSSISWNIHKKDEFDWKQLRKEGCSLKYLIACQRGIALYEDLSKPDKDMLIAIFDRFGKVYKDRLINPVVKVDKDYKAYLKRHIEACDYYVSKLTCDEAWFNKLPYVILTYTHKYPKS